MEGLAKMMQRRDLMGCFSELLALLTIEIVSVTSPVAPGDEVVLVARTLPGAWCEASVYYQSGPSETVDLYPKEVDEEGYVSWRWQLGLETTPGIWSIIVSASYEGKKVAEKAYLEVKR